MAFLPTQPNVVGIWWCEVYRGMQRAGFEAGDVEYDFPRKMGVVIDPAGLKIS
ncbi:MAG: hypothetical protein AB8G77_01925 [Rhodothermales bacterium]